MSIRIMKWIIAVITFTVFIFVLWNCATIAQFPTELRDLPAEVKSKLSPGDTQEKVYSVLGEPLVDASRLGVQVYLHSDSDITFDLFLPFIPFWTPDVHVFSLVTYDENELVKDLEISLFETYTGRLYDDVYLEAGDFIFLNMKGGISETLLGPPISWEELVETANSENGCALVILMGECPMSQVSLDNEKIVDMKPIDFYCEPELKQSERKKHSFYRTFIKREIKPGKHLMEVRVWHHKDYETSFECKRGESIFTEFKVHGIVIDWWYGKQAGGIISLSKTPPESIIEMGTLRPILWNRGTWYGPPELLRKKNN